MLRPRWIYVGLLAVAIAQTLYFYPQMPDTVSSHFNVRGEADDWSSKASLFVVYWGVIALMLSIFAALPSIISRLPNSLINLPNKQYWLAPERRERTLRAFAAQMHWFGVAVLLLLVIMFHLAFSANLPGARGFPPLVAEVSMVAFLIFVVIWTTRMLLAYRVPRR